LSFNVQVVDHERDEALRRVRFDPFPRAWCSGRLFPLATFSAGLSNIEHIVARAGLSKHPLAGKRTVRLRDCVLSGGRCRNAASSDGTRQTALWVIARSRISFHQLAAEVTLFELLRGLVL